jgi:4-amino-4-deoxy-L-arabinose transferase-like glycosyltransferase
MGPGFGLAAWAALAYGAWRLLAPRRPAGVLPLAFVALYFGFMGRQFTLYMRYFLPLYPALALLAGFGLVELMRGASELARSRRMPDIERAGFAAVGLVLVASLLAGVAYLHIYRQPVTRVEARGGCCATCSPVPR